MKCSFHHHPPWLLWERNRWKQYVTSINRAIHLISISIYTRNGVFNEAIFQTGTPLISSPRRKKPKCNRNPIRFCNVHVHVRMLVRAFVIVIIRIENTKHTHTHAHASLQSLCISLWVRRFTASFAFSFGKHFSHDIIVYNTNRNLLLFVTCEAMQIFGNLTTPNVIWGSISHLEWGLVERKIGSMILASRKNRGNWNVNIMRHQSYRVFTKSTMMNISDAEIISHSNIPHICSNYWCQILGPFMNSNSSIEIEKGKWNESIQGSS